MLQEEPFDYQLHIRKIAERMVQEEIERREQIVYENALLGTMIRKMAEVPGSADLTFRGTWVFRTNITGSTEVFTHKTSVDEVLRAAGLKP